MFTPKEFWLSCTRMITIGYVFMTLDDAADEPAICFVGCVRPLDCDERAEMGELLAAVLAALLPRSTNALAKHTGVRLQRSNMSKLCGCWSSMKPGALWSRLCKRAAHDQALHAAVCVIHSQLLCMTLKQHEQ